MAKNENNDPFANVACLILLIIAAFALIKLVGLAA